MSSLLRNDNCREFISFHIRNFNQQTHGTRLCGYYAIAVAIAACSGVDVSGQLLDENLLVSTLNRNVRTGVVQLVPSLQTDAPKEHALCRSLLR